MNFIEVVNLWTKEYNGSSNDPSDILHRESFCATWSLLVQEQKLWIGIGLWPFTTGVFPSSYALFALRRKIEVGICKKVENVVISNFFCFCNLVRIWDKQNFSYNQKRMEVDWIYLFFIWCPLEIRDWYISAVLHQSVRLRMFVLNTPKNPYLYQVKILATFY